MSKSANLMEVGGKLRDAFSHLEDYASPRPKEGHLRTLINRTYILKIDVTYLLNYSSLWEVQVRI